MRQHTSAYVSIRLEGIISNQLPEIRHVDLEIPYGYSIMRLDEGNACDPCQLLISMAGRIAGHPMQGTCIICYADRRAPASSAMLTAGPDRRAPVSSAMLTA